MKPWPFSFPGVLLTVLATVMLGCGGNTRTLQSVTVIPASATSQAQFTATGIYNTMPTSVDITGTTTWCLGSSNGVCDGNIAQQVTVTGGLAQCLQGASGTFTILAGQSGPMPNPDQGFTLKPFGAAQISCP